VTFSLPAATLSCNTCSEATSLLKTIPQKQNLGPEIQQRKKIPATRLACF
jgi:hypothetical protein